MPAKAGIQQKLYNRQEPYFYERKWKWMPAQGGHDGGWRELKHGGGLSMVAGIKYGERLKDRGD